MRVRILDSAREDLIQDFIFTSNNKFALAIMLGLDSEDHIAGISIDHATKQADIPKFSYDQGAA
jgi:hypothetical protein